MALPRWLQLKIENIYPEKKPDNNTHTYMQTRFKKLLCPNFSCCPKNLSSPNFGGRWFIYCDFVGNQKENLSFKLTLVDERKPEYMWNVYRSYHAYLDNASVRSGEILACEMEVDNSQDKYDMTVKNQDENLVGHVPKAVSKGSITLKWPQIDLR